VKKARKRLTRTEIARLVAERCARHVETQWSVMTGRDLLARELRAIGRRFK
jgi:hypothetical protein